MINIQHYHFISTHAEAGAKLGNSLRKNEVNLKKIIKPTTEEYRLADRSLKLIEKYTPMVFEEMKEFSKKMNIPFEDVFTWLTTMYNKGERGCTCVIISAKDKVFFGRNSDFSPFMEEKTGSYLYSLKKGAKFIGQSTAMIQIEDGMNEYGLAAGMNYIRGYDSQPGLNIGLQIRWILENCHTVAEALSFIEEIPSMTTHNLMLADANNEAVVVECSPRKKIIRKLEGKFLISTNHFQEPSMLFEDRKPIKDWYGTRSRVERFSKVLSQSEKMTLEKLQNYLKNRNIVCNYKNHVDFSTIWSLTCELTSKSIELAAGNPIKKEYKRIDFLR